MAVRRARKPQPETVDQKIGRFTRFFHGKAPGSVRGHTVYRAPRTNHEHRPPVIVLHELGGLSTGCIDLCLRLVDCGFTVYMPLLFGKEGSDGLGGVFKMCISREFTLLRDGKTSKVTYWVRSLADRVSSDHGDRPVGIIGMCLTANVVFPLAYRPPDINAEDHAVGAVVAAQPAIPWSSQGLGTDTRKQSLGIWCNEEWELKQASRDGRLVPTYAIRFQCDPISPPERMHRIAEVFGDSATIDLVEDPVVGRPASAFRPHATLTAEYRSGTSTDDLLERVVAFLRDNLDSTQ